MASDQRDPEGTIHHSDQGFQYTAVAFGQRCEDAGVRPSMGPGLLRQCPLRIVLCDPRT